MSTAVAQELTLADVLQQLGGISPRRVRFRPAPGTATEDDVIKIHHRERRLAVYTSLAKPIILTEKQTLTGGDVLLGFQLQLRKLFALLDDLE